MYTTFSSENVKQRRQLGRHRSRWENNIRSDLREIMREGVKWNASGSGYG
jgi:hypothetical protein